MRVPLRKRGTLGLNMTPMIDVVFQLIIFFLLSNHLAQQETHMELNLPTATSAEETDDATEQRVTINVLADGEILLGNQRTLPDELVRRLKFELDRAGSDMEVRIRADRSVPYKSIEPILLACADAGIWNVTFAVYKELESPELRAEDGP